MDTIDWSFLAVWLGLAGPLAAWNPGGAFSVMHHGGDDEQIFGAKQQVRSGRPCHYSG
jgi:hypothetical protein